MQLNHKYSKWKFPSVDTMNEFSLIWNRLLGRAEVMKKLIDMTEPDKTPMHQDPYHAGRIIASWKKRKQTK